MSIKGITIELNGNVKPLTTALKEVNSQSKGMQKELNDVNRLLKFDPKSTELLAQKQTVLKNNIEATKEKLETLKIAQEQAKTAFENGDLGEEEYRALEREIAKTEQSLKRLENQYKQVNSKTIEIGKSIEQAGIKMKAFGESTEKVGNALTKGITVPIAAVGAALIAVGADVEKMQSNIAVATGATGENLQALVRDAEAVAKQVPQSFDEVGKAVGDVNTRFEFTGETLQNASRDFLDFARINKIDVQESIRLVSRAMGDASMDASEYNSMLDMLTVASQKSGVSVSRLTENIAKYGAPMRALGFNTKESIAIFAGWEKAGVNTEIAFSGMKKAISNWSKEGKDSRVEFKKTLKEIESCPDIAKATTKAIEVFGAKAGPDLADAIQQGRFAFDDFLDALEASEGALGNTADAALTTADEFKIFVNELKIGLAPAAKTVMDALKDMKPLLVNVADAVANGAKAFSELDESTQKNIIKFAAIAMAAGPVLSTFGKITKGVGSTAEGIGQLIQKMDGVGGGGAGTLIGSLKGVGTSIMSVMGPTGLLAVGTIALVAFGIAAGSVANKEMHQLKKELESVREGIEPFAESVDKASANIVNFDDYTAKGAESFSSLETVIQKATSNITQIQSTAYGENRKLRNDELESIRGFSEEIGKAYQQQAQTIETVLKIQQDRIRASTDMTREKAEIEVKTAQETKDKLLTIGQQASDNDIALAMQKLESGAITQEAYNNEVQAAVDTYAKVEKSANDCYSGVVETVGTSLNKAQGIEQKYVEQLTESYSKQQQARQDLSSFLANNNIEDFENKRDYYKELHRLQDEQTTAEAEYTQTRMEFLKKSTSDEYALFYENANALLGIFTESKGNLSEESKQTVASILGAYVDLPPNMQTQGRESLLAIAKGMEEKIPELKDISKLSTDEIINIISSNMGVDIYHPYGANVGTGLGSGIDSTKPAVNQKSTELVQGAHQSVTNNINDAQLVKDGNRFSNVGTGIDQKKPEVNSKSRDLALSTMKATDDNIVESTLTGYGNRFSNVGSAIDSQRPGINQKSAQVGQGALSNLDSNVNPGRLTSIGSRFKQVGTGISAEKPGVISQAKQTADGVVSTVDDNMQQSKFSSAGANVCKGISSGLDSHEGSLLQKASSIASRILGTLNSVFKINSPAKTTIVMGEALDEGLEVGLDRRLPRLLKSVGSVADSVLNTITPVTDLKFNAGINASVARARSLTDGGGSYSNTSTTNKNNVKVNVYVQGKMTENEVDGLFNLINKRLGAAIA